MLTRVCTVQAGLNNVVKLQYEETRFREKRLEARNIL